MTEDYSRKENKLNITPIINETEFHSVCASIADSFERISDYIKKDKMVNVIALDVPEFKKLQNNITFLNELTQTIKDGRTRLQEVAKYE